MKKILIIIFVIGIVIFWFGEKRTFYHAGDGKFVTVWKTYGNVCYIIPSKYYGIVRPSEGYIQVTNTEGITLFFPQEMADTIVFTRFTEPIVVNSKTKNINFLNLKNAKERVHPILYRTDAKMTRDVKDSVNYLDIYVRENFAVNKKGERL